MKVNLSKENSERLGWIMASQHDFDLLINRLVRDHVEQQQPLEEGAAPMTCAADLIRQFEVLESSQGKTMPQDIIEGRMARRGWEDDEIEEALEILLKQGAIFVPKGGFLSRT